MAIWFLCTLIFTIFSGLYFAYDPQRFNPAEDKASQVAGLFDACRKGAALQVTQSPPSLLTADWNCNTTSLTFAAAQGLNVPGISIMVRPAISVDPSAAPTDRMVITYIRPVDQVMYTIPQVVAKQQIMQTFRIESNTGSVEAATGTPPHNVIQNGSADFSRVPTTIDVGSVASVQVIP